MSCRRVMNRVVKCAVIGCIAIAAAGGVTIAVIGYADAGSPSGPDISIIDGTWQPAGDPDTLGSAASAAEPRVFFYAVKKAKVVWTGAPEGYTVESNFVVGTTWAGAGAVTRSESQVSPMTDPRIFSNGYNVCSRCGVSSASA